MLFFIELPELTWRDCRVLIQVERLVGIQYTNQKQTSNPHKHTLRALWFPRACSRHILCI